MAIELGWEAWKQVQFGGATGYQDITYYGQNWSAATFKMEVRVALGETGAALISLNNAAAGLQGISATYDAGIIDKETGQVVGGTVIRPQIDASTLIALAAASPASADRLLYADLHVTPAGLPKRLIRFGTFTVKPGSTLA